MFAHSLHQPGVNNYLLHIVVIASHKPGGKI